MALSGHRRHRGYGWGGGGIGYGIPAYAVLPDNVGGDCACKSASANGSDAFAGLESWVKENPIVSLIAVFALGVIVSRKKSLF